MKIDVVDTTDSRLVRTKSDLEKLGTSKVLSYCAMSNGMNQMVRDIMQIAQPRSIEVLRIWAHGTPSVVGISSGSDPRLIREHLTGISPRAFASPHQELWKLAPYFACGARVELRGCQTGSGADAEKLFNELAKLWGVKIYAPELDQDMYGLNWSGPILMFSPGGGTPRHASGPSVQ